MIVRSQEFPFDQVHVAVPDIEQAVDWYRNVLGGLLVQGEPANRLFFGKVRVCFLLRNSSSSADNSSIHHFGLLVTDLVSTVNKVVESGGKEEGRSDHTDGGIMIRDPWGIRLELQPGETTMFDHLEIISSDPTAEARWFQQMFRGESTSFNGSPGLRYGEVILSFSEGKSVRSDGAFFDHIGWRTDNIEKTVSQFQSDGVRFLSGIEPRGPVIRVVFVESPSGVKVEILQR